MPGVHLEWDFQSLLLNHLQLLATKTLRMQLPPNELEPLKPMLANTVVIITPAKSDHVHEAERYIHTLKNKCRCINFELRGHCHVFLPNTIIKALVTFVVMW